MQDAGVGGFLLQGFADEVRGGRLAGIEECTLGDLSRPAGIAHVERRHVDDDVGTRRGPILRIEHEPALLDLESTNAVREAEMVGEEDNLGMHGIEHPGLRTARMCVPTDG